MKLYGTESVGWVAAIFTILSALIAVGGIWWYFQDTKLRDEQWLLDDIRWNAEQLQKMEDIILRQTSIQGELATQSLQLRETIELINRHWQQREQRFEELEMEHARLTDRMDHYNETFQFQMGLLIGQRESGR